MAVKLACVCVKCITILACCLLVTRGSYQCNCPCRGPQTRRRRHSTSITQLQQSLQLLTLTRLTLVLWCSDSRVDTDLLKAVLISPDTQSGWRLCYTDGARRPASATSAVTSKVKVQGHKVTWRLWQVLIVWWTTFPPILVFLGRFNLSANTCQTHHVTWRPWPWRSRRLLLMRVFVLRLYTMSPCVKFVGLPVRKILDIYCVCIDCPGDLELWPLTMAQIVAVCANKHHRRIARAVSCRCVYFHQNWRPKIFQRILILKLGEKF